MLIDGTGQPPLPDGALLVEDARIVAVGPLSTVRAGRQPSSEVKEIDLRPRILLPGLIDCHVHLVGGPEPRTLWNTQYEDDARLAIRAYANAQSALTVGLTTVRDCGARGTVVLSLTQAIADGIVPGPRILNAGAPITTTGGHCYFLGGEADGIEGVQRAVRQRHKAGVDFIKVMTTGGGLTPGSNKGAAQYSQAELDAVAEDAHRLRYRMAGHAHGTEGIRRAVAAGFDTIEHCSWLAAEEDKDHDYVPTLVEEIVRRGIYVCRTMAGPQRLSLEEATPEHPFWPDYDAFRKMVQAGVMVIAGTDAGVDKTPFSGYAYTLETMAGLGEMTPEAILASATRVAAQALGLEGEIGTLEVGKRADAIAVTGNPLEDIRALRRVDFVMRDGRIVARGGQIISVP
jgi:imidazolonepropionase-like amidohydrolase